MSKNVFKNTYPNYKLFRLIELIFSSKKCLNISFFTFNKSPKKNRGQSLSTPSCLGVTHVTSARLFLVPHPLCLCLLPRADHMTGLTYLRLTWGEGSCTVMWLALGAMRDINGWRSKNSLAVVKWAHMCRLFFSRKFLSRSKKIMLKM
jgi:hypothetical protein